MRKSIYSSKQEKLLNWLKEQRLEQNLTMRDLAVRLKRPHSFVGKVEQGERRLDVVEYTEYCLALKIDPAVGLRLISG